MKLFVTENSVYSCKIDTVLSVTKVKCEIVNCSLKESPVGKRLPVLQLEDGDYIFSSNAICRYLWQKCGKKVESNDDMWLSYESSYLLPLVCGLLQGRKPNVNLSQLQSNPPKENTLGHLIISSTLSNLSIDKQHSTILTFDFYKQFTSKFSNFICKSIAFETLTGIYTEMPSIQITNKTEEAGDQERELKLSPEFIAKSTTGWQDNNKCGNVLAKVNTPVLPEKGKRNILITAALPYVNNVPHLGNIVGSTLSADVFARYCRLRDYQTLYIGGTDEYGTATETKAIEMKLTPREICDKFHAIHADIYQWFRLSFDRFGRTSTEKQTKIAQDLFTKLHAKGMLCEDTMDQLFCEGCQRFLADRFVEGICPFCAYEDARGDQCDKCSKLINAIELKQPKCKLCKNPPKIRTSKHMFLDMPNIEKDYRQWHEISSKKGHWTQTAKVITSSWLRDGLKPRCITRDLKWGIPVPLDGYEGKVFYVWFDAPIGYLSITANYTDDWEKWWKDPNNVELYQFMGKDNVPFHSLVFPMCLIGSGDNYTKVNHIMATEYLNYEDTKFSKSRGVGVFGNDARDTGIPADVWRFYLMYLRPESQDTSFSWADLQMKNNSELLNNLGNFINRCLSFTGNNFDGKVPERGELTDEDRLVIAQVCQYYHDYLANMEVSRLRDALRCLLMISKVGNVYIQACQPWVLIKMPETKARCGTVLNLGVQICALISSCIEPFMPDTADELRRQLGTGKLQLTENFKSLLKAGHKMNDAKPLFKKIENDQVTEFQKKFAGEQQVKPGNVAELEKQIQAQGDKVRALKAAKAEKTVVTAEVNILLDLKKQLTAAQEAAKKTAAQDAAKKTPAQSGGNVADLEKKVQAQGDKVRALKAAKAEKSVVTAEVNILLDLKKQLTAAQETVKNAPAVSGGNVAELEEKIKQQGDKVRALKAAKAEKSVVTAEVNILLDLKKQLTAAQEAAPAAGGDSNDVEALEKLVMAQGEKVRQLKAQKDEASVKTEVAVLLDLKKKLAVAKGEPLPEESKKKKKK